LRLSGLKLKDIGMGNEIEKLLLKDLAQIIEQGKTQVAKQVNGILTLTYWQIGKKINAHILQNERGEYGKQVVATVASQLEQAFGRSYTLRNVRRMMQFSQEFPDLEIVTPLVTQLSWSHFVVLFGVKSGDARKFYAQHALGVSLDFLLLTKRSANSSTDC